MIVPCGHGSLVLGVHRAFMSLSMGGAVSHVPRILAVQSEAYSSVARAWADHIDERAPLAEPGGTIAEGIATRLPLRGRDVLAALRASGCAAVSVSEGEIRSALVRLLRLGFYVEPTAAVGVAGLELLRLRNEIPREASRVVVVLTGNGLKAGRRIVDAVETASEVQG